MLVRRVKERDESFAAAGGRPGRMEVVTKKGRGVLLVLLLVGVLGLIQNIDLFKEQKLDKQEVREMFEEEKQLLGKGLVVDSELEAEGGFAEVERNGIGQEFSGGNTEVEPLTPEENDSLASQPAVDAEAYVQAPALAEPLPAAAGNLDGDSVPGLDSAPAGETSGEGVAEVNTKMVEENTIGQGTEVEADSFPSDSAAGTITSTQETDLNKPVENEAVEGYPNATLEQDSTNQIGNELQIKMGEGPVSDEVKRKMDVGAVQDEVKGKLGEEPASGQASPELGSLPANAEAPASTQIENGSGSDVGIVPDGVPITGGIASTENSSLVMENQPKEEATTKEVVANPVTNAPAPSTDSATGGEEETNVVVNPESVFINDFSRLENQLPTQQCGADDGKGKLFLMLMSSHTGSTALMSILSQHPDMQLGDLENFEPLNKQEFVDDVSKSVAWTREYFTKARAEGRTAGFKLNAIPVMRAKEEFGKLIAEFNIKVIWNYRMDILKRAIGRYPAYWLGDETAIGGVGVGEASTRCDMGLGCSFKIDSMENLHCTMTRGYRVHWGMEEAVGVMTRFSGGGGCAFNISYDDFLHYPDHVSMQMQDYLGLRRVALGSTIAKATSDNMCDVVENYAEVCANFNDCASWKKMLNDPSNNCTCDNYTFESKGGEEQGNQLCSMRPRPDASRWCGGW